MQLYLYVIACTWPQLLQVQSHDAPCHPCFRSRAMMHHVIQTQQGVHGAVSQQDCKHYIAELCFPRANLAPLHLLMPRSWTAAHAKPCSMHCTLGPPQSLACWTAAHAKPRSMHCTLGLPQSLACCRLWLNLMPQASPCHNTPRALPAIKPREKHPPTFTPSVPPV